MENKISVERYEGVEVIPVEITESIDDACEICEFAKAKKCNAIPCTKHVREDGNDVYFIKVFTVQGVRMELLRYRLQLTKLQESMQRQFTENTGDTENYLKCIEELQSAQNEMNQLNDVIGKFLATLKQ